MQNPWDFLNHYRDGNSDVVDLRHFWPTLPELLDITVDRHGDRRAFTSFDPDELTFTYAEIQDRIRRTASYLSSKGVKRGDCVAVTGKNSPEWGIAYLAVLYAAGTVVPIDNQLNLQDKIGLAKRARVKIVFADEEAYDGFADLADERISLAREKPNYILDIDAELAPRPELREDDLAAILFTSGTTGVAKGVMLSHKNIVSDAFLSQTNLGIYPTDVFYALLPLHHSYTMLAVFIEAISVGAEVVFGKRMAVQEILKDLKRGKVTMLLSIPLLFNKLLKGIMAGIRKKGMLVYAIMRGLMGLSGLIKKFFHVNPGKKLFHSVLEKASLEHIRICISGGGPLPSFTFRRFNQLGIDFVQGYGLTETSPIITLNPVEHYKEESVGKVIPQTEFTILNPDERGVGEIAVKGPMVMQGYFEDEEATKESFTEDGYFRTGDMGYLDRENYLYLTGRQKNLIVTAGGKNVYPEEIENAFELYDEVDQIMVKGYVSDERLREESVEAYVYPDLDYFGEDAVNNEEKWQEIESRVQSVVQEVNQKLMPYQRVQRVTVLKSPMEMTTTKKIKRHKVAAGEGEAQET
ncbi:MAG: AMP-binding protein [Spirochaetes bacterium]|jgi:long-chain acyl-CoA synthetase|nr:AMP-binding protein [Spirochaetota bacterium]